MRCDQFDQRLQNLLDRRSRPEWDASLRAHAVKCDDCASKLDLQRRLFATLRSDTQRFARRSVPFPPSHAHSASLCTSALSEHQNSRPTQVAHPYLRWSVAAACLLLISLSALALRSPLPRAAREFANAEPPAQELVSPQGNVVANRLALAPAVLDPTTLRPVAGEPPLVVLGPIWTSVEYHFVATVDERRTSLESIAGGLRPVTDSLTTAMEVLRRTFFSAADPAPEKPQAQKNVGATRGVA